MTRTSPAEVFNSLSWTPWHLGTKEQRGWWLGIFFIVLVCLLWAGGSVLVQHVDDVGFKQPFAFVYIANVVVAGCLPLYMGLALLRLVPNPPLRKTETDDDIEYKGLSDHSGENGVRNPIQDRTRDSVHEGYRDTPSLPGSNGIEDHALHCSTMPVESDPREFPLKSHHEMFKIALSLCIIWFLSQWSYVSSLAYTSVTSSTIIANSSALFTYAFNVMAKTERLTFRKSSGVALTLAGAILVGLADNGEDDSGESLRGDLMALFSAIGYGVYTMILTLQAPSDEEISMTLVLGYVGTCNLVIFLPLLVGLALAPAARVLDGLTWHVAQLVVTKAVFDNVLSELLWARAILLTTATVATVGCSLTIPIAFATDFVSHGDVPEILAVFGALLVVGGFLIASDRESKSQDHHNGQRAGSCQSGSYHRLAASRSSSS